MKIISHNGEQEKAVDSSIKNELNEELEAVLSHNAANPMQISISAQIKHSFQNIDAIDIPWAKMIHLPHTSPHITTMMRSIRLPTPTLRTPLRPPIHLTHKHILRIKLLQPRRVSIRMPIDNLRCRRLIFSAPKPIISRPNSPLSLLALPMNRSRAPQRHEPRVEEHDVQHPEIG